MISGADLTILVAILAGLLSFLSPCVLPLLPSYLACIAGVSFEELQGSAANARRRRAIFVNSLCFVLGFSLVFIALGAGATFLGQALFRHQALIRKVGGGLIVILGLSVAGWLRIPFFMREWRGELSTRPAGCLGALLTGITFGAGWTPCIGPILGSILTLASLRETASAGILMLAAYSVGLAVPFLASALLLDGVLAFSDRIRRFAPAITRGSGLILIGVGVLLFTDYFTLLSQLAFSLTPDWLFAIERSLLK